MLSLIRYMSYNTIDITISGKGNVANNQFAMSVVLEMGHEEVHMFYTTTRAELSVPRSPHFTQAYIIIHNIREFKVSYKAAVLDFVPIKCNNRIHAENLLYNCEKVIKPSFQKHQLFGSFDIQCIHDK